MKSDRGKFRFNRKCFGNMGLSQYVGSPKQKIATGSLGKMPNG